MTKRTSVRTSIAQFDKRSLLLFTALTLGTAGATWAQSTAASMDQDKTLVALFTQADKNADNALNPEEAKAMPALAERFAEVDTNSDGVVSKAEFEASTSPAKK